MRSFTGSNKVSFGNNEVFIPAAPQGNINESVETKEKPRAANWINDKRGTEGVVLEHFLFCFYSILLFLVLSMIVYSYNSKRYIFLRSSFLHIPFLRDRRCILGIRKNKDSFFLCAFHNQEEHTALFLHLFLSILCFL